ncbi:hypothetical protein AX17_003688 [Amanita inopinata Kibby_2008]|nr:hypothetical protein AX17_003688 [Amanita inopinata Kibby_2008]
MSKSSASAGGDTPASPNTPTFDIEHIPVNNDPRKWSPFRKNLSLALVASASMIAGLAGNIQNPAVKEMEDQLHATSGQFSLSISIFILLQGLMPLAWSAVSEIKGRRLVYLVSLVMFTIGSVAVALSPTMQLVIGFRCFQATGSSAVMTIGAATLADIFDTHERGTKMGIYYIAPLLGPAIGPIFGGVLTTGFNWRAVFWFLTIVSGISCFSFFFFFRDTFRKERSLTYQNALKSRIKHLSSTSTTPKILSNRSSFAGDVPALAINKPSGEANGYDPELGEVKVTLRDLSPFKPIWLGLCRPNNLVVLVSSGLSFAFNFVITYTTARTLGYAYHYNPLRIGFSILAYGLGCVGGSLTGGRWSDHSLAKLKEANGGESYPEMRLKSTVLGVIMLPPVVVALGWISHQRTHIAALCIFLFLSGFFSVWIYTSTLAYIVDSNKGRSSIAVATNSAFRGVFAFVGTEIAVPLQDGLGDGWMMTLWGFLMLISGSLMLLVYWKDVHKTLPIETLRDFRDFADPQCNV